MSFFWLIIELLYPYILRPKMCFASLCNKSMPNLSLLFRRQVVAKKLPNSTDLNDLPFENYNFANVSKLTE